jgi:cell division septation protein DedD
MDDVENSWGGYYLIHISSFRESGKARNEVVNLEERGFPVFIVFLNLGPKGSWYRVYAGPLDTRDDARAMKKLLDDTPGVRFTRITQVPRQ